MKKLIIIHILLLFAWLSAADVQQLQTAFNGYIEKAESIFIQYEKTDSLSKSLAQEISELQVKSTRKNKRRLYQLYPQAEALAVRQQSYLDELTLLSAQIEITRRTLSVAYQAEIDSLSVLHQEKSESRTLTEAREKLSALHKTVFSPPIQASEMISIDVDDTPQVIQAKADLYRDRADKYRDKAKELQERRSEVLQNLKLRRRVSEMVSDVQLMDSRDEIDIAQLQSTNIQGKDSEAENIPIYSNDERWSNSNIANTQSVRQANNLLNYDFRSPTANFEDYIEALKSEEEKLLDQADSLYQIASEFSIIHQNMTDQLK